MITKKIRIRYSIYTKYYVVESGNGVFITDESNIEDLKYPEEIIFEGTFDDCVDFIESTNLFY